MSRFIALIALLLALPVHADWTANRKNFNFRSTAAYVTDGSNTVAVVDASANSWVRPLYPTNTTVDGDTFDYGWVSVGDVDGVRDRNNAIDVRLAGMHFKENNGTQFDFRVDVPAGTYNVWLAIGDADGSHSNMRVEILDNTTSRLVLTGLSTGSSQWYDASGTLRTSAALWAANQTAASVNITSGTLIVRIGSATTLTDSTVISHLGLQRQSAGASAVPIIMQQH